MNEITCSISFHPVPSFVPGLTPQHRNEVLTSAKPTNDDGEHNVSTTTLHKQASQQPISGTQSSTSQANQAVRPGAGAGSCVQNRLPLTGCVSGAVLVQASVSNSSCDFVVHLTKRTGCSLDFTSCSTPRRLRWLPACGPICRSETRSATQQYRRRGHRPRHCEEPNHSWRQPLGQPGARRKRQKNVACKCTTSVVKTGIQCKCNEAGHPEQERRRERKHCHLL